jgi:hypothetical protein
MQALNALTDGYGNERGSRAASRACRRRLVKSSHISRPMTSEVTNISALTTTPM